MPTLRIDKDLRDRCYFITLTIIDWIDIFTSERYFEEVINTLKFYQEEKDLSLFGYVIMTNHLHMIAQCVDMIDFVRGFKSFTTRVLMKLLEDDRRKFILERIREYNHRRGKVYQIWNSGNWPKICEEEKYFEQKLDYIHENPVLKGYVERPEDWKYSSARNYYDNDHSVIRVDTDNILR